MPYPFQARDVFVQSADLYMALLSGATMGDKVWSQPNFIWLDLVTGEMVYYEMGQNRRFTVECEDQIFFAPWKTRNLYEFDVSSRSLAVHPLPARVNGLGVREFMHTVHACGLHRVYVANNNNPVVFVWDTRRREVIQTFALARLPGGRLGDTVVQLLRNPALGVVYVVTVGPGFQLVEIDERTLTVRRTRRLPHLAFDIALSPDGLTLYSQALFRGYVSKIDARTLRTLAHFDAPVHGRRVLVSRDGRWLYLASYLHGTLWVVDARTGERRLRIFITPKLEGIFQTARFLYLYGAEGVFRLPMSALRRRL